MKATLEFNLPEDQQQFTSATNANKYASILWDIRQEIRGILKHGTERNLEDILEGIRSQIPTEEELYI